MEFPPSVTVKTIGRQHAEYARYRDAYAAIELLYKGGVEFQDAVIRAGLFLEKAPKELPEVYAIRQKRVSYTNLISNVIGWYQSALFKDSPQYLKAPEGSTPEKPVDLPKDVSDFCADFEEDADGGGCGLTKLLQQASVMCLLFRRAFILIDTPGPDADEPPPANLKAQANAGLLDSYLVLYSPLNVINWELDERGNLEWVVIHVRVEEQEFLAEPKVFDYWYFFDREECALYQREVKTSVKVDSSATPGTTSALTSEDELASLAPGYPRPHALTGQGRVPMHVVEMPEGLWLGNRIYLPLLNHLNQDNALDFMLFQSNLPQLVIKGQYDDPVVNSPVGFHSLPTDGDMFYLEPEGKAFEAAGKRIDGLEERIYKACYLMDQARTNRSTPAAQSGISKQQDKTPSRDAMSGIGDILRPGIQAVYQDVLSVRGFDNITVDVRGFDFSDKVASEDLDLLEKSTVVDVNSPTYEREIAKKAVRLTISDANPATLAQIDKEIEQNPTGSQQAAEMQAQKQAALISSFSKAFPGASQLTQ